MSDETSGVTAHVMEVGQAAPDFELRSHRGGTVRLGDLRGQTVVLVFFPWAFTGVCTGELCALRDDFAAFDREGVTVLAISCDASASLRAFAEREGYPFTLLSDHWPHGATAQAYGIFDERAGCALRATFVVDGSGVVRWSVVNGIPDARDLADYKRAIADLAA